MKEQNERRKNVKMILYLSNEKKAEQIQQQKKKVQYE
jgi:hypothetical protein